MKGHIRERSRGHWAIVLDSRDATGKRKRKWHSFKGSKRQAQVECARLISEHRARGGYQQIERETVADFLRRWLAHMQSQLSPKSHERYTEIVNKNLIPALGSVALARLQPLQVSDAYAKALASGRRDGRGGLAPSTVLYLHRVLKHALSQAVRWRLLTHNPADAVDPPKRERSTMQVYDMAQTAELIEAVRETRLFVPVLLGALCGLRRGEIAALRWGRVDFTRAQIAIVESAEQTKAGIRYKEPKSGRTRSVALSGSVADELRAHRARQAEELLRLGVRATDDTFVYTREDGLPVQPRSITHAWQMLRKRLALPRLRFHGLRHTHATHLLASGVHPKIASERLGHSKIGITLDLYSHILPGMQADAAARVDDALREAVQKRAAKKGSK